MILFIYLCLQWNGSATTTLIEGGVGWMNVQVSVLDIDANLIVVSAARAIVDGHQLPLFAVGAGEKGMIASNNFSTVYNPFLTSQHIGYNSGNLLLGLLKCDVEMVLFDILMPLIL